MPKRNYVHLSDSSVNDSDGTSSCDAEETRSKKPRKPVKEFLIEYQKEKKKIKDDYKKKMKAFKSSYKKKIKREVSKTKKNPGHCGECNKTIRGGYSVCHRCAYAICESHFTPGYGSYCVRCENEDCDVAYCDECAEKVQICEDCERLGCCVVLNKGVCGYVSYCDECLVGNDHRDHVDDCPPCKPYIAKALKQI